MVLPDHDGLRAACQPPEIMSGNGCVYVKPDDVFAIEDLDSCAKDRDHGHGEREALWKLEQDTDTRMRAVQILNEWCVSTGITVEMSMGNHKIAKKIQFAETGLQKRHDEHAKLRAAFEAVKVEIGNALTGPDYASRMQVLLEETRTNIAKVPEKDRERAVGPLCEWLETGVPGDLPRRIVARATAASLRELYG